MIEQKKTDEVFTDRQSYDLGDFILPRALLSTSAPVDVVTDGGAYRPVNPNAIPYIDTSEIITYGPKDAILKGKQLPVTGADPTVLPPVTQGNVGGDTVSDIWNFPSLNVPPILESPGFQAPVPPAVPPVVSPPISPTGGSDLGVIADLYKGLFPGGGQSSVPPGDSGNVLLYPINYQSAPVEEKKTSPLIFLVIAGVGLGGFFLYKHFHKGG